MSTFTAEFQGFGESLSDFYQVTEQQEFLLLFEVPVTQASGKLLLGDSLAEDSKGPQSGSLSSSVLLPRLFPAPSP